jgi:hypothetical protein
MNTNQNVPPRPYRSGGSSLVGGIVLIVLGLIFFVGTQGIFNFDWNDLWNNFWNTLWPGLSVDWSLYWPLFPLGVGLALLLGATLTHDPDARQHLLRSGTILVLLSVFFFAATWQLISWALWPILLVVAGVLILFAPRTRRFMR